MRLNPENYFLYILYKKMTSTKSENFSDYVLECRNGQKMTYETSKTFKISDIKDFVREEKCLRRDFYDTLKYSKLKKSELINIIIEYENSRIQKEEPKKEEPKKVKSDVKHSKTTGDKKKKLSKSDINKNIIINNNMDFLKKHLGNQNIKFIEVKDFKKLSKLEKSLGDKVVYKYQKSTNLLWIKTQNWISGKNPKGKPIIGKNTRTAPLNTVKNLRKKLNKDMIIKSIGLKDDNTHYYTYINYDEYIKVLNEKNYCLFEIIEGDRPFKPYFDIDGTSKKGLNVLLDALKKLIPDAEFSISGSEMMKNKKMKYSYHITINNYKFSNMFKTCGIKEFLNKLTEEHNLDPKDLDAGIYNNHRVMKSINQTKEKKDNRIQKIIKDNNPYNHLITYTKGIDKLADNIFESYYKLDVPSIVELADKRKYKKPTEILLNNKEESKITKVERQQPYININKMKARDLLKCICPSNIKYDVAIKIALWCIKEGLTFQDFYNWGASYWGHNEEWRVKWLTSWSNLETYKTNNIRRNYIKYVLEKQYGTLVDKHRDKFFNAFYTLKNHKYPRYVINKENPTQYIQTEYFEKRLEKYLLFCVGMGAGKTYSTIQFLKKNKNLRFLWITNRISLKDDVKGILQENNICFDDYKTHNGKMKDKSGKVIGRRLGEYLQKPNSLICEIESIYKYEGIKYDVIIMDEIESLFNSFLTKTTHGDKKKGIDNYKHNFNNFCNVIKKSKKVFMMDAFLSKRTTDFIKDIEGDNIKDNIFMIQREDNNPQKRNIRYYLDQKRKGCMGFYKWYDDLITTIKENKVVYVFYPHKGKGGNILNLGIDDLAFKIMKECGLKREDIAIHFSGSEDNKHLVNVREYWSTKKVIITNTTISVGVSYDIKDYVDEIFMCYDVFINPRDLIQSSNRIRHPKNKTIKFVSMLSLGFILNDFSPCEQDAIEKPNELYNDDKFTYKNVLKNLWNNYLILEYDTKDEGTLYKFFEMAQMGNEGTRFGDKQYRERWIEMNEKLDEKPTNIFDYDTIEVINEMEANNIRDKMNYNRATIEEQQQLRRFYNDHSFIKKTDEKVKKSFWMKQTLLNGFIEMREQNSLIDYVFKIDNKLWNNVRTKNYACDDDDLIIKFNKDVLTKQDKDYISSKLHLDITHTDKLIKKNILTYYFGKGCIVGGKEGKQHMKNYDEPLLKGWFKKLLEYFVKYSRKNVYHISRIETVLKKKIYEMNTFHGLEILDEE